MIFVIYWIFRIAEGCRLIQQFLFRQRPCFKFLFRTDRRCTGAKNPTRSHVSHIRTKKKTETKKCPVFYFKCTDTYFFSALIILFANSSPILFCASSVEAPIWGVKEMFGWFKRSARGVGSLSNTSKPAAATLPEFSA